MGEVPEVMELAVDRGRFGDGAPANVVEARLSEPGGLGICTTGRKIPSGDLIELLFNRDGLSDFGGGGGELTDGFPVSPTLLPRRAVACETDVD